MVIFLITFFGSKQPVLISISQKIGLAPALAIAFGDAIKVCVGTIISLPFSPKAMIANSSAIPPELTLKANLDLKWFFRSPSNLFTNFPLDKFPLVKQ